MKKYFTGSRHSIEYFPSKMRKDRRFSAIRILHRNFVEYSYTYLYGSKFSFRNVLQLF